MKKNIILVEFHNWKVQCASYYFLIKAIKKKNYSVESFITFHNFFNDGKFKKICDYVKIFFGNIFLLKNFAFYKSIGVDNIFTPIIEKKYNDKAFVYYNKFFKEKISRNFILKLKINNIYIGDVLYDSYLRCHLEKTIDINEKKFVNFFINFLSLYFYWENYFANHNVKAVLISHELYLPGIPARIAASKNIKSIACNNQKLFQFNKKFNIANKEFLFYRDKFKKLDNTLKKQALRIAEKKLNEKFNGSTYYYNYLGSSSFNKKSFQKRVIKKSNKFKVLILPHSFIDTPHVYGPTLFDDSYQWLNFLIDVSKKTKYDWYIKIHPDFNILQDHTGAVIKKMISEQTKIISIDSHCSHHQIINEGINAVFTIHGSVGSEYPFFDIPVVNASINNPHIKYNFNMHPKNIKELENIIYNLPKLKIKIDKNEIKEFFFMHKILAEKSWLGTNINQFVYKMGGDKKMYSNQKSYNLLMKIINEKEVLNSLKIFLKTDKYFFDKEPCKFFI